MSCSMEWGVLEKQSEGEKHRLRGLINISEQVKQNELNTYSLLALSSAKLPMLPIINVLFHTLLFRGNTSLFFSGSEAHTSVFLDTSPLNQSTQKFHSKCEKARQVWAKWDISEIGSCFVHSNNSALVTPDDLSGNTTLPEAAERVFFYVSVMREITLKWWKTLEKEREQVQVMYAQSKLTCHNAIWEFGQGVRLATMHLDESEIWRRRRNMIPFATVFCLST